MNKHESDNFCSICGRPNCEDIECSNSFLSQKLQESIKDDDEVDSYTKLMNELFDEL